MKSKYIFLIVFIFVSFISKATNWYASPSGNGTGTFSNPFNLQVALSSPNILPGDTLWLRGGIYTGRFVSDLVGNATNYITIESYPGEWAILNGNISPSTSTGTQVLYVNGAYVTFKDFELTYNNLTLRNSTDPNFINCDGIFHGSGINCKFINLNIHDNPGIGFYSGKFTDASLIYGCLIYNNGYFIPNDRGHGPGFYVQNASDSNYRILKNNIVFNNFYKGFEVWSASIDQPEIVKNITIDDNTVFNSASVYSTSSIDKGKDNILVATENNNTVNFPKNINIINNVLYHNTDFTDSTLNGDANSLRIGYPNSKAYNIFVDNNFTVGRNPGMTINRVYNLTFTNNFVLSKYVFIDIRNFNENLINSANFIFNNNKYYTRFNYADFRIIGNADYSLSTWKTTFGIDLNSTRYSWLISSNSAASNPPRILRLTRNEYNQNVFKIVLFNSSGNPNVSVDFSSYGIPSGTTYTIKDVENYPTISSTGVYNNTPITFNLNIQTPPFIIPSGTDFVNSSSRTPDNFGVFLIEFSICDINKIITTNVNSGNTENHQASNTIVASNTINSNAVVNYHAASQVILSNGFYAISSTIFRANIEDCTYTLPSQLTSSTNTTQKEVVSEKSIVEINMKKLTISPNPSSGRINIELTNSLISEISLNSFDGIPVFEKKIEKSNSYQLDIIKFNKGIYMLIVKDNFGEIFTDKIIKN